MSQNRMTQNRMDTRPDERDISQPTLGLLGMVRWAWRQLTSMRTALFLLLLLAIGAVPGSIWPQRNIDAGRVERVEDGPQRLNAAASPLPHEP